MPGQTNDKIFWSILGLSELDREIDQCIFLIPEIDQGKVLTPKIDCEIDREKVFGTNVRVLEKSRNIDQEREKKNTRKIL